jgi:hypothetical protein
MTAVWRATLGLNLSVLGALAFVTTPAPAEDAPASATATAPKASTYISAAEARMRADVGYLADDRREGRGPGTGGLDAAADYIAAVFREAGLKPAPGADGYFQPFTIPGDARPASGTKLSFGLPGGATLTADAGAFTPLQRGGSGKLDAVPIVFAGYGITAKDDDLKLDYDDYKGLDVKGKIVLILRQEPQADDEKSPFAGRESTSYAAFRHKARNAADKGAAGVLLINNTPSLKEGKDVLLDFSATDGDGSGAPFLMISRELADKLLAAGGKTGLEEVEKAIDAGPTPQSRALDGVTASIEVKVDKEPFPIKNVIGVLEGEGPLADETIVVGAHYDHVGLGGPGSLAPGVRAIHNGADDNASGTTTILELARRMARRVDPLPRRIVFIAFSGEERGLLGSKHYVENPLYPLDKTVAMLNFDMVGRMNDANELIVFGAPSIDGLVPIVEGLSKSENIKAKIITDTGMEFNASDHASFYRKNIPVFFAFTGTHPDYHRPSDDTNLINFAGMTRIANLGELLLLDLARRPVKPTFVKMPAPAPRGGLARAGRGGGAYLGTRPAYGEEGIKGVKLEGVTENSPAEKAGIKGGDIIVKFDGKDVSNIEDFMERLMPKKPGDEVEIVVKRGDKEETLKAKLGSRAAPN